MQLSTAIILLAFISVCWGQATLFITGGKCLPRRDDANSGVKRFRYGDFNLYGTSYDEYVVHSNGYVTVTNSGSTGVYDSKNIVSLSTLTNGPMIAAFWSDVDNRAGGKIFYKETRDDCDLTMATMIIGNGFEATSVMVATWQGVGYYDRHNDKRNTFQVVLAVGTGAAGDTESYIIFLYNSIGWTTTDSATEDGTLPAQVGFTAGDGSNTQFLPRFSNALNSNNNELMRRLGETPMNTNIGMLGVYVCRSDRPGTRCTPTLVTNMQGPYPIDEFVTRSQARAEALGHLSSHPEKTQLNEEEIVSMEMELDSVEHNSEPQAKVNKGTLYTEYSDDM